MAAAADSQVEAARKLARLKTLQRKESSRRDENELAAKEREKQERWNKALESQQKQDQPPPPPPPTTKAPNPQKPKVLQPV
jgi:hypothetical protein